VSAGAERLRTALREAGGSLGAHVCHDAAESPHDEHDHAAAAAAGPRVAAHREEVELAVAAVREGYELHYGRPRVLEIEDADFGLLAGDRLYALGLARLAAAGDLAAIAELADIISASAQAHAGEDPQLADEAWRSGTRAIGWGRKGSEP